MQTVHLIPCLALFYCPNDYYRCWDLGSIFPTKNREKALLNALIKPMPIIGGGNPIITTESRDRGGSAC